MRERPDNEQEMKSNSIWSHLEGEHLKPSAVVWTPTSAWRWDVVWTSAVCITPWRLAEPGNICFKTSIISLTSQSHFQDAERDFGFKVLSQHVAVGLSGKSRRYLLLVKPSDSSL